jgi:hypothetical protein
MAFIFLSGTPHQPPSSSAGPNVGQQQMNIPPFTAPNELNNATVIDSGTIGGGGGGEGNQQQQQPGMEREDEDEMRASGQNEAAQQQLQDRDDEDGSPASGQQLRIAEEEEDGP